jgi:hypothetical protein
MSDQISEKMANKIFDANEQFNAAGLCSGRERFISALKHFGLIKPSKLDEAREWCLDTQNRATAYHVDVIKALQTLREKYEAAISEILEERK